MKKTYSKPYIAVESFQLNAAIAGACKDAGKVPINHGSDTCTPANVGIVGETYIGNLCTKDIVNADVSTDDGLCYQALENVTNLYLQS